MVVNYNKFFILLRDQKLADVELNAKGKSGTLSIKQYVDGIYRQFSKPDDEITSNDFLVWLDWRTCPQERFGVQQLLQEVGIKNYNRITILHKTHGVMGQDDIWVRFDGEELTFNDVYLKRSESK